MGKQGTATVKFNLDETGILLTSVQTQEIFDYFGEKMCKDL